MVRRTNQKMIAIEKAVSSLVVLMRKSHYAEPHRELPGAVKKQEWGKSMDNELPLLWFSWEGMGEVGNQANQI